MSRGLAARRLVRRLVSLGADRKTARQHVDKLLEDRSSLTVGDINGLIAHLTT